ncbi:substrate-binding domain-containing protein [Bifidobacterium aquikefiri]|uniref:LacI family DNA-binding transcriptional regulator n=1 Tax=Bifidobacterium aquikefiri TaxID=1653207 RepID=UPI0039EB6F5F
MNYVTIKDVAQEAGVSVPTVSQVLNNRGRISAATRQRVLDSAKKLDYIPNSAAISMRSSSTKTVGILVPDINNSYFAYLISLITRELLASGYVCMIGSSSESLEGQDKFLHSLLTQRIDGAILVPQGTASHGLQRFVASGLPLVILDRKVKELADGGRIPIIDADPRPGITDAIKKVKSQGHSRIGFIHGPTSKSPNLLERQQIFIDVAGSRVGSLNAIVASHVNALSAIKDLLSRHVNTFIFGYSPDALEAIRYFHHIGLKIGEDVSIVSFDDIPIFELASPSISVISQQQKLMGNYGVTTLLSLMEHRLRGEEAEESFDNVRIPTLFIDRESVSTQ